MSKKNESVTVCQMNNPRYDQNEPKDGKENAEFTFKVEKTVNTLRVHIGQYLTPDMVETLIGDEVTVTVLPVK